MKLEELQKIRERAQAEMRLRGGAARVKIVVGMGTSGIAAGARTVMTALLDEIQKRRLTDVIVTQSGEKGFASQEPVVEVIERDRPTVVYGAVDQDGARRIVAEHVVNGTIVEALVLSVSDESKE
ncbi:MAG: ferredoxin [Candidatus Bipolaricaulia bacterium]